MFRHLLGRWIQASFSVVLLGLFLFFLMRMLPGKPYDTEMNATQEIQAALKQRHGLNESLSKQLQKTILQWLSGDLGVSFQYTEHRVTSIIAKALPISLSLGGCALIFSFLLGISIGLWNASRACLIAKIAMNLSLLGLVVPNYLLSGLLIFCFALKWHLLPAALWEEPCSAILPTLTLAFKPMGTIALTTQACMKEILTQDYIRTARSQGISSRKILFKYGLKNALAPLLSLLASTAPSLLSGSFLVETIFQIPGMGQHFVQAIFQRDYPFILGSIAVFGIILILCHFLCEMLMPLADPRIRWKKS
jgi:ABC-type dipeptide/oligopeptide/nickel transport system permease component